MFFDTELHTKGTQFIKKANAIVQGCLFAIMLVCILLTLADMIAPLSEIAEYKSSSDSKQILIEIVLPVVLNIAIYVITFLVASVLTNVFFGYYYDHRCIRLTLEEKSNSDKQEIE